MSDQDAPARILIVDDEPLNIDYLEQELEVHGFLIETASNGLEALEVLRRERFDVVLMDVEMPVMDGLEASRRIHQDWPEKERPRIIAMTANAMQGDRETCLAAGMDDYLSKPIRADVLAAALGRCAPRAVLDAAALERLDAATGDRAFVVELVDTFLLDAPALVGSLRSAQQAGRADELRRSAHTLKSNARTFGATALAALCEALERTATAGVTDEAAQLVAEIEDSFAHVEDALVALRAERRA
jgi:CheY-like chemotaxis protein